MSPRFEEAPHFELNTPQFKPAQVELRPPSEARGSHILSRLRVRSRLGNSAIYALILGTILITLVIAFLALLWVGFDAESKSRSASAWRAVLTANWAPRSITLCALVLRWTVSVQAVIATAMLAAFILEHGDVPLHSAAAISLLRNSNNGPFGLFWELLQCLPRITSRTSSLLIIILFASTVLLQFSSTALLSDLGNGIVINGATQNSSGAPYYWRKSRSWYLFQSGDYWLSKPTSYPIFAERPGTFPSEDRARGIVDSGHMIRAFLPYNLPSERTRLAKYSGFALAIASRVQCYRPNITGTMFTAYGSPQIWGNVTVPGTADGRLFDRLFRCTVPLQMGNDAFGGKAEKRAAVEWAAALCEVEITTENATGGYVDGYTTLVLLNMTAGYGQDYSNNGNAGREMYNFSSNSGDGPWARIPFNLKTMSLNLTITLCLSEMNVTNQALEASGTPAQDEPLLGWDAPTGSYKSEGILRQFGTTAGKLESIQDRGLLELPISFTPGAPPNTDLYSDMSWTMRIAENTTIAMCTHGCYLYDDSETGWRIRHPHRAQVAVFQDILATTKNPAQALLAQYFTLLQMAYYDGLPDFDNPANATASFSIATTKPVRWNGFSAVITTLTVHALCICICTILFIRSTRLSVLGNPWQAVAHVANGETEGLVAKASVLSGEETASFKRTDSSSQDITVSLQLREGGVRVGLVSRAHGGRARLFDDAK